VFGRIQQYRLRRQWLITGFGSAFFAGVFLAHWRVLGDAHWVWCLALPVLVSWRRHNWLTLLLLCVVGISLGWWRGSQFVVRLSHNEQWYGRPVTITGQVDDDATYGKQYQLEFTVHNGAVLLPRYQPLVGTLTIGGYGEAMIYRGDVVQAVGKLQPTLGGSVASMRYAQLTVVHRDHSWLNQRRRSFIAGMQTALPEPLSSFAMGLLIGQRSSLPDDVSQQLKAVGLTHVIAVSGYNLTIIVMACRRLFAKRSKYQTMLACLLLMGLFLMITGSSPPIARASIVSTLSLLAWYYGRQIKPLVLIMVSGFLSVYSNPLYLWGNVSWYLSFLSFFGVLMLAPLVSCRLCGECEPKLLLALTIETICATIFVVPYSLYIFGQVSLVSLVANLLVVPLVPAAMLLTLAAGIAGMVVPGLCGWLAWPTILLLTYMLDVTGLLSRLPFACVRAKCWIFVAGIVRLLCYNIVSFVFTATQGPQNNGQKVK
jgi:competence protein ComEC